MSKHEYWELQSMQRAPLSVKVAMTKDRLRQWIRYYGEDGVYLSYSGGKDSFVPLHILRGMGYERIPAVFVDVPTQYPELRKFAERDSNLVILTPKKNFFQVCEEYGFPLISKEVSECVHGARKYMKSLLTGIEQTSTIARQTDRQTRPAV